jgi:protein TonB
MYAVQKSSSSTRTAGAFITAGVIAGVSLVLANGVGSQFEPVVENIAVLEFIEAPPEVVVVPPPPVEVPPIEVTAPPPPVFEAPEFVPPEAPETQIAAVADIPDVPLGPPVPVVSSDRIPPKLRVVAEPPYPVQSRRAQEQGVSGIEVCVDERGRVTSANLRKSSGHTRLDSAALQWIRDSRFTPGSVGGAPQPMCGHRVDYEWRLDA